MNSRDELHEREVTALIKERDYLQEMCDKLAACIAPDEVLGEHSSMNDPWTNALEYAAADPGQRKGAQIFLRAITDKQQRQAQ